MLADLKQEENCFLPSILGCVAEHMYKTMNLSRFQDGEFVTKKELKNCGALDAPYTFIKRYGHVIGISELPKAIFSKEYCYPSVHEENVWEKIGSIEGILQEYEVDLSMNLYSLGENKVHNTVVTAEKTVSASKVTSSICIMGKSKTSRPRNHHNSFNLVIEKMGNNNGETQQLHCSNCLNVGKFMYTNVQRFSYDKSPEELAKILKVSVDSLTSANIGGIEKVPTGERRRSKTRDICWQLLFNCNACMTVFVRKKAFKEHIKKCVGGHVSGMNFSVIPHVEHFEEKEYPTTLLCPIVASFDTEACGNTDIARRVDKNGDVYKSDERKKAEMVLVAVVVTVIVRPNKKLNYTLYNDLSMSDTELLDYKSTVPWEIRRHIDVEDLANFAVLSIVFGSQWTISWT